MFTRFREIVDNHHEHARELKARGQKVVGYFCTYTPEELIYAAGAVPVRILSCEEQPTLSDGYLQPFFCPFARSILDQALKGKYDYLDGLVAPNSCDTLRLTHELWTRNISLPFADFVVVPTRVDTPGAKDFFIKELTRFKGELERAFGTVITDADLWRAIEVYNTSRGQMKELYVKREDDQPEVSGTETLLAVLSSMLTDKTDHNQIMKGILAKLPERPVRPWADTRLMLVGSEIDNTALLELIEGTPGAMVVTDDSCTGSRYVWDNVPAEGDPLVALASRYLDKVPCPTKHPPERRFKHIFERLHAARAQGVVIALQKFCDPHGFDYPELERLLKEAEIPMVYMDLENKIAEGQVRTRVEAFLEMVELEMV